MNIKLKLELIKQAQQQLVNNPQDSMHEITHHYRVVSLAKQLVHTENMKDKIDMDLLEVVCWWHDVKVQGIEYPANVRVVKVTAEYLSNLLPEDLRQKAFDSIAEHEFGSTPSYLEGKILQDADKLEILSEARVDLVVDSIAAGILDKDKMLKTLDNLRTEWLPNMQARYHFEFSKRYHEKNLSGFTEYLTKTEEIIKKL